MNGSPRAFFIAPLSCFFLFACLIAGCGSGSPGKTNTAGLVDTAEVTITGSVSCQSPDGADYTCLNLEAIVDANDPDSSLDDRLQPTHVLLSLRFKNDASFKNRWILFESGGDGNGFGPESGGVPPGYYEKGGKGYGDDLIRWYNEAGYITVDVVWECRSSQPDDPCFGNPDLAQWVPAYPNATGWFRNTGGAGYTAAAGRTRAVLNWMRANNGGKRVGAHGHSSGSGRLLAVMTRYGGESYFDTVVIDGGPVLTYFPWFCGITDDGNPGNGTATPGPLGPKPINFDDEAYTLGLRLNFDDAWDPQNGDGDHPYSNCADHVWDETAMLTDSNFYLATDRDFSTVDLSVLLGGEDRTPASVDARLWFQGYAFGGQSIPPLSAKSITIRQGYCPDPQNPGASYFVNENDYSCSQWKSGRFPEGTAVDFAAELASVPHQVAMPAEGAMALYNAMVKTLELHP